MVKKVKKLYLINLELLDNPYMKALLTLLIKKKGTDDINIFKKLKEVLKLKEEP